MAKLIDLTGATVTVPSGWSATSGYGIFSLKGSINVIVNSNTYSYNLYGSGNSSNFYIGYNSYNSAYSSPDAKTDNISYRDSDGVYSPMYSDSNYSFSLVITGGSSVSNSNLIQWFVDNGATIEGGVWEEEKTPIIIKNPITIFNKVEEINGVPIEISSLDSTLLVAENEGKVYKYDGKLYRVIADLTTKSFIDLTGATITVPSGYLIPSKYGYFNISGNIGRSLTSMKTLTIGVNYNIFIGYTSNLDPSSDLNVFADNSLSYWSNTKDLYFKITGGIDATNKLFIQWFVDNNATIEGGTYVSGFIFQEILSPSGTLDITANGEVDVKTYEKVNVNVENSGGAELNIHYGDTAPTDTSKLWVKCDTPSKVEVLTNVSGGNETLDVGIATLPKQTHSIASALVGDKVYLFGGIYGSNATLNTINVFNTETNTIETLSTTLPTGAYSIAIESVGTKIYLFGGINKSNSSTTYLNTINVFDTETNTIQTLSTKLPSKASSIATALVGNNIYLFGGSDSSNTYLNTINVFNTETNTIQTLSTTFSAKRSSMASAVVGTKVYLFGGYSSGSLKTINVFDTETNTIETLSTTLPTATYSMASAVVGTKVYLFGGTGYLNTINVFDTETNTIETLSTILPSSAKNIASAVVGTKIYLFGGYSGSYLNTIHRFNVVFNLPNNHLFILNNLNTINKVSIIKSDNLDIKIGVKIALLGNSNNEGESVEFAVHNGNEWVSG